MALKQGKKRVSIHGMATNGIIAQHSGGSTKNLYITLRDIIIVFFVLISMKSTWDLSINY